KPCAGLSPSQVRPVPGPKSSLKGPLASTLEMQHLLAKLALSQRCTNGIPNLSAVQVVCHDFARWVNEEKRRDSFHAVARRQGWQQPKDQLPVTLIGCFEEACSQPQVAPARRFPNLHLNRFYSARSGRFALFSRASSSFCQPKSGESP